MAQATAHSVLVVCFSCSPRHAVHMLRRCIQVVGTMQRDIGAPDSQVGHGCALGLVRQQEQAAAGARGLCCMQQRRQAVPLQVLLKLVWLRKERHGRAS